MNNFSPFTEAFNALQDPQDIECNSFGAFAVVMVRKKLYMRLTDTIECAHIWYIHESGYGWKGLEDMNLAEELSDTLDASSWTNVLNPIINFAMTVGNSVEREACKHNPGVH